MSQSVQDALAGALPTQAAETTSPPVPAGRAVALPGAASLIAQVGYEIEIGSARVHPFVPKGTILIDGEGWTMETDRLPPNQIADVEFVLSPSSDLAQIDRALDDITRLVAKMRSCVLGSASRLVALAELDRDDAGFRVREEARTCWIEVRNVHFPARIQATYGIGLLHLAGYLNHRLPAPFATTILDATHRVESSYRQRARQALPDRVRGFVHLLNYYLECAQRQPVKKVESVHVHFGLYMRSDFCAVFDKLLDDAERAVVRDLLLPAGPLGLPPLMSALDLPADRRVFKFPYYTQEFAQTVGPTIIDWLISIVNGRGEGVLRKDLMSPPPGYRLPVENVEANYGGGGMGVDEVNQLALFEIRSTPRRTDLPLNRQTRRSVVREYLDAKQFNSHLRGDGAEYKAIEPRHRLLCRYDTLYTAYRKLLDVLAKTGDARDAGLVDAAFERLKSRRRALAEEAGMQGADWPELAHGILALDAWIASPERDASMNPVFSSLLRRRMADFERQLWDIQDRALSPLGKL